MPMLRVSAPSCARGARAFTLVELLVVISIIVTLAAIVTPVVITVRQRALVVDCTTHLQQLALAAGVYHDDIDKGRYPPHDGAQFVAALWRSGVMREPRLFVCPANSDDDTRDGDRLQGAERDPVPAGVCSYAGRRNAPGSPGSIQAAVRAGVPASRIAILCDRIWQTPDGPQTNHGDRVCVAFLDGHVEVLMVDKDLGGRLNLRLGPGAPPVLAGLECE